MPNKQKPLTVSTAGTVSVVGIWKTIQGEGPFVGCPAVFVRLAGCNLQCPMCDTDYTTGAADFRPAELVQEIFKLKPRLVVFTGGEPLRQTSLWGVFALMEARPWIQVQVETNGSICPHPIPTEVSVVCSPKTSYVCELAEQAIEANGAYKYVVEHGHVDDDGFPTSVLGKPTEVFRPRVGFNSQRIYIQPIDTASAFDNVRHTQEAVKVCMKHGYRLCLQVHKLVGLQ